MVEEQQQPQVPDNPLMRKKKTPEELAREAEAEDEDEFTSKLLLCIPILLHQAVVFSLMFPLKTN